MFPYFLGSRVTLASSVSVCTHADNLLFKVLPLPAAQLESEAIGLSSVRKLQRWFGSLYLRNDQNRFRSKHALHLTYIVNTGVAQRVEERLEKLMDRIGATDPLDLPPRPKYMRRRTYEQLREAIIKARLDFLCALGIPLAIKMRNCRARLAKLAERSQNL